MRLFELGPMALQRAGTARRSPRPRSSGASTRRLKWCSTQLYEALAEDIDWVVVADPRSRRGSRAAREVSVAMGSRSPATAPGPGRAGLGISHAANVAARNRADSGRCFEWSARLITAGRCRRSRPTLGAWPQSGGGDLLPLRQRPHHAPQPPFLLSHAPGPHRADPALDERASGQSRSRAAHLALIYAKLAPAKPSTAGPAKPWAIGDA